MKLQDTKATHFSTVIKRDGQACLSQMKLDLANFPAPKAIYLLIYHSLLKNYFFSRRIANSSSICRNNFGYLGWFPKKSWGVE